MTSQLDNYLQLSNDRSHLLKNINPQPLMLSPLIDIYDLIMVVVNVIIIVYIFFNFLRNAKKNQQNNQKLIKIEIQQKTAKEIPFFQCFKKKGRNISKKNQSSTQVNSHSQEPQLNNMNSGFNLIELKCLKCNYTAQIYQRNALNSVQN